jgi:hypothetical protein
MSAQHTFLKFIRQLHLYLGAFTAPALLFFAFTGGLQTFGLHEAHRGSDYRPPAWLATMAQLHKKQTMVVPAHKRHPPPSAKEQAAPPRADAPAAAGPAPRAPNAWPLKIFVALVALGLFLSTLSGIYMAYRYTRNKRLVSLALAAGVVVPVLLALF